MLNQSTHSRVAYSTASTLRHGVDDLGFEKTVDRLSQRIVIAVADAHDRGFDAPGPIRFDRSWGEP